MPLLLFFITCVLFLTSRLFLFSFLFQVVRQCIKSEICEEHDMRLRVDAKVT
jgi:hypothetical protein